MKILKPEIMVRAGNEKKGLTNIILQTLRFFLVFSIIEGILGVLTAGILVIRFVLKLDELSPDSVNKMIEDVTLMQSTDSLILSLFMFSFMIFMPILFCKLIEKRSLYTMGFTKKKLVSSYLVGLFLGFVMFAFVVLLNVALGGMTIEGLNKNITWPIVLLFFIGFIIQGMGEEVMCRGYLMNSIGANHSIGLAILISSIAFALLHSFNPGLTVLAVVNLFLFGVFAALYMILTNNIWGVAAIHSIWNFAQGNFFGISVSGAYKMESPIFFVNSVDGKQIINGGTFGAEGGLAVTIVLIIGIAIILGCMIKQKKIIIKRDA